MKLVDLQLFNLDGAFIEPSTAFSETQCSYLLLDWITDNPLFQSEVFESKIEISGQEFFRFSINATDNDSHQYYGFGRSKDRLQAASIAAGEVLERYVAKKILKSEEPLFAKHQVNFQDSEISTAELEHTTALPSPGFHSSNGWAVHFSLKKSVENSALEALERHTLLYSYLHSGWSGFNRDSQVPFKNQLLTPYVSRFTFGGFSAGIVATEGDEFAGRTFGYLCDTTANINRSQKWLNAFFESYDQWESLSQKNSQDENESFLTKYQKHFLINPHRYDLSNSFDRRDLISPYIKANILILDITKTLNLPVPLYAAFTFGGDLIPLFFRQKLSKDEIVVLQKILKSWELSTDLPEYHPIL